MKLNNIRSLGRYVNTETNKGYNIYKGASLTRGTDHIYYLYRGARVPIMDRDFYEKYKKVTPTIKPI